MKEEMIILSVKTRSSLTAGCYDWGETHLIVTPRGKLRHTDGVTHPMAYTLQ